MTFLYVTDLHGDVDKYNDILAYAIDKCINLIHIGADILPKGPDLLSIQKKFVNGFLKKFYERCAIANIKVLASFGNDDIYTRKSYFLKYGELLDQTPYVKEGFEFSAYNFVPDYPFSLKTACKLDSAGWIMNQPFFGKPKDVNETGIYTIEDDQYFAKKGTIEDDLCSFKADKNSIVAIHCPPTKLGLDVCINAVCSEYGNLNPQHVFFCEKKLEHPCSECSGLKKKHIEVGSMAIYNWIERNKPLLCLAGHIHESFLASGKWSGYIGRTLVVQPGQLKATTFVIIEINGDDVQANRIEI